MKRPTISHIRLGWLQRFCAVAHHRDFGLAALECNVDPTSLSDSVQRLEDALCKPLIAPATTYITLSGRKFSQIAREVLELSTFSSKPCLNVRIGWFKSLIQVSYSENYSDAGRELQVNRYSIMRGISGLQEWIGEPLTYFDNRIILTTKGQEVSHFAMEKISLLEKFKGDAEVWYRGRMIKRKVPWYIKYVNLK